ncbi:MAG: hypothetical protein KDE28_17260, partial [Anaerolineales bacterium]|nr:hypothetical protein [Anaerolineales bacterium]
NNLGNLYTKLGWPEKAAAHFQATIDLRQTTGTLDGTGFLGLGNAQRVMGQFAAAAHNYDRARDLFLSRNWLYTLSFLHLSQACLDFARGDYQAALEAVKLAEGNRQQHGGV